MARKLSGIRVTATLQASLSNDIDGGNGNASWTGGVAQAIASMANGTGANQANRFWQDTNRPLVSTGNDDINIYSFAGIDIGAGAGLDAMGQALALTELVALLVYNQPGSAGNLNLGGQGTANAWTSWIGSNAQVVGPIKPGGAFLLFEPVQPAFAIGNANNNLLRINASGGNIVYDLYILGRQ